MKISETKDSFRRFARAGIPFNPLAGGDFKGANLTRLQQAMQDSAWKDPRFITADQAAAHGWSVPEGATGVEAIIRDSGTGKHSTLTLFNASNVVGMPGLQTMLAFSDEELQAFVDQPAQTAQAAAKKEHEVQAEEVEEDGEELVIAPSAVALEQAAEQRAEAEQVSPTVQAVPRQGGAAEKPSPDELSGELVAYAPYFLDRLHNFEGVEMVKQINSLIAAENLGRNRKGIELLLSSYPNARRFGVEIAPMEKLRDDTLWKVNPSEPKSLLDGALVRDKQGAYRPAAGGLAVLKDSGTSLALKSKSEQAYRSAMELAKSKGWAAIELKGKPKMMAKAWIEAKLMGLEVVNYKPTVQDRAELASRIADQEQAQREQDANAGRGLVDVPEFVEVRPVVDGQGREVLATVAQKVSQAATTHVEAEGAAPVEVPVVARTVTRVGDVVREDVQHAAVQASPESDPALQPVVVPDSAKQVGAEVSAEQLAQAAGEVQRDAGLESVVLVAHGPAPYDNNPRNKASYFAKLRDPAGGERTIWGVDLPRSLEEAAAAIGDTISLAERGRQPVTVEGELPGGGVGQISAHRVRWETTVHAKCMQHEVKPDVANAGLHLGPVMKIEGGLIGQKNGRDPDHLVWHDATKLDGPIPEVGAWAEIHYSNGRGKSIVREQQQAQGVER